MRGRSCTQPFLVEGGTCRLDAFLLPPRWANRSPPHPTRLRRPTFPPRGRLWGVETQRVGNFLSQKCFPAYFPSKNASQISLSIPEEIAPQPYQRQRSPKRASGSKRAINPGSRGLPLVFFPPTFFKESRAPPPESAGNPRCRVHPATVPTEPPTDDRGPPPGRRPPGALRPKAGFGAAHPKGTQAGYAARAHSPALAPQGCSSSWACWR